MTQELLAFAHARGAEPVLQTPALEAAKKPRADPEAPPPSPSTDRGPAPEGVRILLVEDDTPIREVVAFSLKRKGYRVTAAAGPTAALQAAEAGAFELLITDLVMPVMDGRALADRLAATRPDLRILFTSGHARQALRGGLLRPEDRLLTKPFNMDTLSRVVREILGSEAT